MSRGYVYILTNEAMPGLVKIGKTTRSVEARIAELYQTGVPFPFKAAHYVYSPDCHGLETHMHQQLDVCRLSNGREFFRCEAVRAAAILDASLIEQVSLWLDMFIPDQVFVHADLHVCIGQIHMLAAQCGEPEPFIAEAMSGLTADEIAPALDRVRQRVADRKVMLDAKVIRIG